MKRIISTIMTLSALALLLASCGKEPMPGKGRAQAIKLTVSGVYDTKAQVITDNATHSSYSSDIYDFIESDGFYISAYVTGKWRKDRIGQSEEHAAGLYVDPEGGKLQDKLVTYDSSRSDEDWRITGNEDYDTPSFSWISGVATNFFAHAPKTVKGSLTIKKADDSTDANYPFSYAAKAPATTTTPIASGDCEDIIFAHTQNTASFEADSSKANYGELIDGSTDVINLTFYHALAQIRFCVDPAEFTDKTLISATLVGPKDTTDPTKYVGIASKGDCTFAGSTNTFSWNSSTFASRYAYSQTFGTNGTTFGSTAPTGWTSKEYTSPVSRTIYTCEGDVILIIPQTLADCGVEVTIKEGSDDPVLLKGNLPATTGSTNVSWAAGKYYTYKIGTTGTREDLSLTMTLVDWAERESYIPIN